MYYRALVRTSGDTSVKLAAVCDFEQKKALLLLSPSPGTQRKKSDAFICLLLLHYSEAFPSSLLTHPLSLSLFLSSLQRLISCCVQPATLHALVLNWRDGEKKDVEGSCFWWLFTGGACRDWGKGFTNQVLIELKLTRINLISYKKEIYKKILLFKVTSILPSRSQHNYVHCVSLGSWE